MNPTSRPLATVATCIAALALVAGCSSGSSTTSTADTTEPTPQNAATSTPLAPGPRSAETSGTLRPTTSPSPSSAPATEFSPPGDIPDDQVFVPYSLPGATFKVSIPEGWARSTQHGVVSFTDKLNSVSIQIEPKPKAPSIASARRADVPILASSVSQYAAGAVSSITRRGGQAILITYQQDSPPDPVTGKVIRDAVERYEFWRAGQEAILTLSGPVGADNVDPWRIISDSLNWK